MAVDGSLVATIGRITGLINEAADRQRPYVEKICTACPSPCCTRVHYLYTEADLHFLKLAGEKRRWRADAMQTAGCWFLGPGGCTLAPAARPMICHRYICPDLETEMNRREPDLLSTLGEKFRQIGDLQRRLMALSGP